MPGRPSGAAKKEAAKRERQRKGCWSEQGVPRIGHGVHIEQLPAACNHALRPLLERQARPLFPPSGVSRNVRADRFF